MDLAATTFKPITGKLPVRMIANGRMTMDKIMREELGIKQGDVVFVQYFMPGEGKDSIKGIAAANCSEPTKG